jgi:hypothetical protein
MTTLGDDGCGVLQNTGTRPRADPSTVSPGRDEVTP